MSGSHRHRKPAMSRPAARAVVEEGPDTGPDTAPHQLRRRLPYPVGRAWWWLGPLLAVGIVLILLLASTFVAYKPFTIYSYRITPEQVCPGAPVRNLVDREFTAPVTTVQLSESWVTVRVPGFPPDRPISTESSELPPAALTVGKRRTVPSPLLTAAPTIPGVYGVRIVAQTQGTRFGFIPAIGSSSDTAVNQVTVLDPASPACATTPAPKETR